jgi:hypothetical protein
MHFLLPKLRVLVRAGGLVTICLLWASIASAAPAPRAATKSSSKTVCDPVATRRLPRHPRSFGGPLRQPKQLLTFDELTSHVARTPQGDLGNENQAIQNDAPAARMDAGDRPEPTLRALGLLAGSIDPHPRTLACSPKAPRGPPVAA